MVKRFLKKYQTHYKAIGLAGLLFFMGKGIVWIIVFLVLKECN